MPDYNESGLRISLPDGHGFRFQDMPAYKGLSGQNLKEMDFGWWDSERGIVWLLEVKDYSDSSIGASLPVDHLLAGLRDKATDALLILAAAWLGTDKGHDFSRSLPSSCRRLTGNLPRLKIVFVLKVGRRRISSDLPPLKDKLNQVLKGRVALFDVPSVILTDHNTAAGLMRLPIAPF
jgi:hypothetical protein